VKNSSNPVSFYISGSEKKEFNHAGGPIPHTVFLCVGHWVALSLLIFAHDSEEVIEAIKGMVKHRKDCLKKWEKYAKANGGQRDTDRDTNWIKVVERAIKENKIEIEIADRTQCYKIGWAGKVF
jgi:hypothetical protein